MRILKSGGALKIVKRLLVSTIIIAMVFTSIIAPLYAEYSPLSNDDVILDDISEKEPGDIVTVSGTTTFAEITIKVLTPNKTILYVSTVKGGNFTDTFTLPGDAKPGIYEVVAGVGSTVATVTFEVKEETSPVIVSIDEVNVTTEAGTAPVLPAEVTARYSDGSSRDVAVVWDEIDPSQYATAGIFTVEGTVEGTDIKATAVVTVEEAAPVIVSIDEVNVTTKAGTAPVLPAEVTVRYSDGSSRSVAVVWDEIDPSQYATAGTFTVEGTVEGTDIKAIAVVTVTPLIVNEVKLDSIPDKEPGDTVTITGTTTFSEITIKVLTPNKIILFVSTVAGGSFTDTFILPVDAKPGIYEVVAGVGSTVATTTFEVVEKTPPTIVSIDEVSVTTKAGTAPVLPAEVTARYSDGSSKSVAVVWDEIDPSQYASAGTFTVEGTVEGTDIKAIAAVTVEEVPAEPGEAPVIELDQEDCTVTEASFTVSGTVTDADGDLETVTVNGEEVEVDEEGKFSVVISLKSGENIITVIATDREGNTADKIITVTYNKPSGPVMPPIVPPVSEPEEESITRDGNVNEIDNKVEEGKTSVDLSDSKPEDIFEGAEEDESGIQVVKYVFKNTEDVDEYSFKLPVEALNDSTAEKKIILETGLGTIELPSNMLSNIDASTGEFEITVKKADTSQLSDEVKAIVGDRPVIELSVKIDGQEVDWANDNANVVISLQYKPTEDELNGSGDIIAYYIDNDGNIIPISLSMYDEETGTVRFITNHFSMFAVGYASRTFDDLSKFEWARKEIEALAARGVINGIGNNLYAPEAFATRGEFIKLLVNAFGLKAEFDENFDDVSEKDFFYKEAGIAKALGLIKGYGDGRFGSKDKITREDMVVIISRMLDMLDKGFEEADLSELDKFADKAEIASYAKEILASFVKEGIIKGSGDYVNPKGNTNRAEMAVILYRILAYYLSK